MLNRLLVIAAELYGVGMILIAAEWLRRSKFKVSSENLRKMVHIVTGIWVSVWWLSGASRIEIIAGVAVMLLVNIVLKYDVPGRGLIKKIYNLVTGAKGKRSVFDLVRRKGHGEIAYGLGMLVSAVFARNRNEFILAVLILALADGLAAVVGTRYGKHKVPYFAAGKKSVEGSASFFAVAVVLMFALSGLPVLGIVLTATVLMFTELSSRHGEDNLLLPALVLISLRLF